MIGARVRRLTVLAVILTAMPLSAQVPRSRIYSTPPLPSDDALRRLNLHLAWRIAVPTDGQRDGLLRVEVIGPDLFVLTRSGLLTRIDAETGLVHWRTRQDKPYTTLP